MVADAVQHVAPIGFEVFSMRVWAAADRSALSRQADSFPVRRPKSDGLIARSAGSDF
jgi:hypothetical protein